MSQVNTNNAMEVEPSDPNPKLSGQKITIQLQNGEEFLMPKEYAFYCGTIKNMCEDMETSFVPLPNVGEKEWNVAFEYMEKHYKHHVQDAKSYYEDAPSFDEEPLWAQQFIDKVEFTLLMNLMLVGNFLEMPGFLHLVACRVANEMKDLSPQQLREKFNIENDFTPEEEEAIRKRTEFCEALY